jgi:hypothetical protein
MFCCLFVLCCQRDEQCSPSEVITFDQQGAQFEPAPLLKVTVGIINAYIVFIANSSLIYA